MADEHRSQRISIGQIQQLLGLILPLPRPWAILVCVGALLSGVRVRVGSGWDAVGSFHLSWLAAVMLSLLWLPALMRVVMLAGGALKTPAGEAGTPGLLDLLRSLRPETEREALPAFIAALDEAEQIGRAHV